MNAVKIPLALCLLLVASACSSAAAQPSATPEPSPTPIPTPAITPAPTPDASFTADVYPAEEPVESRVAIPGEKVSFLVVVSSAVKDGVSVSATATGAKITSVQPAQVKPGEVGEVWLVPEATEVDALVHVTITLSRAGATSSVERTVKVMPMKDERAKDARPYFQLWLDYLIKQHPELGITTETKWEPTFVSTFLVVSHYAYYSDDWEMKVSWHNMIPPYDWTEVYLRHRGTGWKPSLDFKIDSVSGKTAPYATTPPDAVMR